MRKNAKESIKYIKNNKKGITLVALVVTIIVLLILAGVTITSLLGDDGIIAKAQRAADLTNAAIQQEQEGINALLEELNSYIDGNGGDDTPDEPDMPEGWNSDKVTAVESKDNVTVPVPIGFTASKVAGEESVATGFVIKQGPDGSATSGINEFVWVPVEDPSTMFGTNVYGNSLGKLYDFGTSSATAQNWTEQYGVMWSTSPTEVREPDIVTQYDGNDATSDSSYFTSAIGNITGEEFKEQLQ